MTCYDFRHCSVGVRIAEKKYHRETSVRVRISDRKTFLAL